MIISEMGEGVVEKKDKHEHEHEQKERRHDGDHKSEWIMNMEDDDDLDNVIITSSESSSLGEFSRTSHEGSTSSSSSSTDNNSLVDDASSSTSNSSRTNSNGSLYDMSELMAQLPIKRGISKYFQGKSQSFTSLSSVKGIEELAKKGTQPYRKKMKSCKSLGDQTHKLYTLLPRATISKKVSTNLPSFPAGRRSSFSSGRPPPIPVHSNFSSV